MNDDDEVRDYVPTHPLKPDCTPAVPPNSDPRHEVNSLIESRYLCTDGSDWSTYQQAVQREHYLKLESMFPGLSLVDWNRFTDVDFTFEEFHLWALDNAVWLKEYTLRVLEDK